MNDFDALYVKIALDRGYLAPSDLGRLRDALSSAPAGAPVSQILVNLGILDWRRTTELLTLAMEALRRGERASPNMVIPPAGGAGGDSSVALRGAGPSQAPGPPPTLGVRRSNVPLGSPPAAPSPTP
ncbi:MAG: hypothetical protein N3A38_00185, partial [Planctomycetota bacterium]|nr:hypothetical protein [Planctomycetota bacterium]